MIIISSKQNEVIKKIKSLHKKSTRKKLGLYIVEGLRAVEELKDHQWEMLIFSSKFLAQYPSWSHRFQNAAQGVYEVSEEVFASISDTEQPQGIMAICKIPSYEIEELLQIEEPFFILCDQLQDPGNLGTIIRTADACGANGVFVNKGTVDPYSPKVIRSMMGAQFHLPVMEVDSLEELLLQMHGKGIVTLGTDLSATSYYHQRSYKGGIGIVIGNEANGVSQDVLDIVKEKIKIPMIGQAESLNASVAAGVIMYEVVKQRNF